MQTIKHNLQKTQVRMVNVANKHRTDREFQVGDWVYLKLRPHRQVTVRQGAQHKLAAKYYGPFMVESKIGKVAYRLKLPATAAIHLVFHISQLKLCHGNPSTTTFSPKLPSFATSHTPIAVLDRQLDRRNRRNRRPVIGFGSVV